MSESSESVKAEAPALPDGRVLVKLLYMGCRWDAIDHTKSFLYAFEVEGEPGKFKTDAPSHFSKKLYRFAQPGSVLQGQAINRGAGSWSVFSATLDFVALYGEPKLRATWQALDLAAENAAGAWSSRKKIMSESELDAALAPVRAAYAQAGTAARSHLLAAVIVYISGK